MGKGRQRGRGLAQTRAKALGGRLSSFIRDPLIGLCGPGNGKQLHANGSVPRAGPPLFWPPV